MRIIRPPQVPSYLFTPRPIHKTAEPTSPPCAKGAGGLFPISVSLLLGAILDQDSKINLPKTMFPVRHPVYAIRMSWVARKFADDTCFIPLPMYARYRTITATALNILFINNLREFCQQTD